MKYILILIFVVRICTNSYSQSHDTNENVTSDLIITKIGGSNGSQICIGDTIKIYCNHQIAHNQVSDFNCPPASNTLTNTLTTVNWSGITIFESGQDLFTYYCCSQKPWVKAKIVNTSTVTLNATQTSTHTGNCNPVPGTFHIYYTGQITINANPSPPKPLIIPSEILHPSYTDGSKTLKLDVRGCEYGVVNWLRGDGFGQTQTLGNPFNCSEFQVSCNLNGCVSPPSEIITPSKSFKPSNAGYSNVFLNYVQSKANEATLTKSPKEYRTQYFCILYQSYVEYKNNPSGWASDFVKYNFDYAASHNQCKKSTDLTYYAFADLGDYHVENELVPAFNSYPIINCNDARKLVADHETFLANAVSLCFDNLITSQTNTYDRLFFLGSKAYTFWKVRQLRDVKIFSAIDFSKCSNYSLKINFTIFPPPPTKSILFNQGLDSYGELKVKDVTSDTTFFIKVGNNIQLKISDKINGDDLTNSTNTIYSIEADTTIATINQYNGQLKIKKALFPYANDRKLLIIKVENSGKVGYGQFAIYDTDIDNDNIANSFEESVGLNPSFTNYPNTDQDNDGLSDYLEVGFLTSPINKDTDGDGFSDLIEYQKFTDANNPYSFPDHIYSIKSGSWNDSTVWSCNCIPTINDDVRIKTDHRISISRSVNQQFCKGLYVEYGAIFENESGLFISNPN